MRRPHMSIDATLERLGTGLLGLVLMASALLSATLARDDAAVRGVICGIDPIPHCGWCYGAVGFALAGLTAFGLAVWPALAPASARRTRA